MCLFLPCMMYPTSPLSHMSKCSNQTRGGMQFIRLNEFKRTNPHHHLYSSPSRGETPVCSPLIGWCGYLVTCSLSVDATHLCSASWKWIEGAMAISWTCSVKVGSGSPFKRRVSCCALQAQQTVWWRMGSFTAARWASLKGGKSVSAGVPLLSLGKADTLSAITPTSTESETTTPAGGKAHLHVQPFYLRAMSPIVHDTWKCVQQVFLLYMNDTM